MSATALLLQLHHREAFERNVTRAVAAGALAGAAGLVATRLGVQVPLAYLAVAFTVVAFARGDKWDVGLLAFLGLLLPALPWLLGPWDGWALAASAALGGGLLVRGQVNARGEEGQVGAHRPALAHYLLGAGLGAGLAAAGAQVARVLELRLLQADAPALAAAGVAGAALGLFFGLASVAGHVALAPDPVTAQGAALLARLHGALREPVERSLGLYGRCGELLAALPREPAREELARTLSGVTRGALALAEGWAGLEAQLDGGAAEALQERAEALARSAAAARDAVARRQLEAAAAGLREEVEHLEGLQARRERVLARLDAHAALLERARVALLGLRSGHAELQAAELSALARRLQRQSEAQAVEAQVLDAAATGAALAQLEGEAAPRAAAERVRS